MNKTHRAFFAFFVLFFGLAHAQNINVQNQFAQCQRYFNQNDLELAQSACNIALAADPQYLPAKYLKARILIAQKNLLDARDLMDATEAVDGESLEFRLLQAEYALAKGDTNALMQRTNQVLNSKPSKAFEARALRLQTQSELQARLFDSAVPKLRRLLVLNPNDSKSRRLLASALLLADPKEAVNVLRQAPDGSSPLLLADLGRARWIGGDLNTAIRNLEQAVVNPRAFVDDPGAYKRALGALSYAYYGQGKLTEGARAFAQIPGSPNLLAVAIGQMLPWLAALLVLMGCHLVGESRIEPLSTIEIQEGARPWTVSSAYGVLLLAALLSAALMVFFSGRLFGNYLAILTPVQSATARDIYFAVFASLLALGAIWITKRNGWSWRQQLLGPVSGAAVSDGLLVAAAITALVLVYQFVTHRIGLGQGFYLEFTHQRNTMFLALLALPLSELFFRAFALFPFEKRYGRGLAFAISALLSGLSLGGPILLTTALGFVMVWFSQRLRATAPLIVGRWIGYAVLLILVATLPLVRSWF